MEFTRAIGPISKTLLLLSPLGFPYLLSLLRHCYSFSHLLDTLNENGIRLIFIITLLAQQKSSLANVLTLFHLFHTFFTPFVKTVTTDLIETPRTLLDSLCWTKGKHLITADRKYLHNYKSLCTWVKLICTTLQSAISPHPSIKDATVLLFASMDQKTSHERIQNATAAFFNEMMGSFATYQLLAHTIQNASSHFLMHWKKYWFHPKREGCWGLAWLRMS